MTCCLRTKYIYIKKLFKASKAHHKQNHTTTPEPTSDVNVTWGMRNRLLGGSCRETVVSLWLTAAAARLSTPGVEADRGGGWFLRRLVVEVLLYTSNDSWFPHNLFGKRKTNALCYYIVRNMNCYHKDFYRQRGGDILGKGWEAGSLSQSYTYVIWRSKRESYTRKAIARWWSYKHIIYYRFVVYNSFVL